MTRSRTSPVPDRRPLAVDPVSPEHAADRALRLRDRSAVPAAEAAAFDAVLAAFDRYEAGEVESARELLQGIGLASPFLEWKLFLRGLIAYSAGDDARARENWERLEPQRLPARLAAPLRAAIDPTFSQPIPEAVRRKLEALTVDRLTVGLRHLRGELGRGKSLAAAFRRLDSILPLLRSQAPDLLPRLATCFYRAIQSHGEEGDLARFRKAFGSPPEDPEFQRLLALVNEESDQVEVALRHWLAYEAWLATNPGVCSADLARRARAIILHRLGNVSAYEADDPSRQMRELVLSCLGPARGRARPAPPPDPLPFWRRAVALEPDWDQPAQDLFHRLMDAGQVAEAEAVARQHLANNETSLDLMDALADLLMRSGRAAESLELRLRMLTHHPLDRVARLMAAVAALATARRQLINREYPAAEETFGRADKLCREETLAGYLALRSVAARAQKKTDEADALQGEAEALANCRPAVSLMLAVDGVLTRLRPTDRKKAEQALTEVFATTATPREASLLYAIWDQYSAEGLEYRGQKGHERKIRELILRTSASDAPEVDFEHLCRACLKRQDWKLVGKLAEVLREKFPANPVFPLMLIEQELNRLRGRPGGPKIQRMLRTALQLAERSPHPRHRVDLDRLRELSEQIAPISRFLPFF